MHRPKRLVRSVFDRPTLTVARELLGQRLVRLEPDGGRSAGLIIETQAYVGSQDQGSHARAGRTRRNASMWGPPGHAYVYFTYGMHWMLNVVTEAEGFPAAVLIRALLPVEGVGRMRQRRRGKPDHALTDGPAKLCQALDVDSHLDGHDLCQPGARLFIEAQPPVSNQVVTTGPRVGLNLVPEPWKSRSWRFRIRCDAEIRLIEEELKR
jgi:DNA-3-methyladenine glycosylase